MVHPIYRAAQDGEYLDVLKRPSVGRMTMDGFRSPKRGLQTCLVIMHARPRIFFSYISNDRALVHYDTTKKKRKKRKKKKKKKCICQFVRVIRIYEHGGLVIASMAAAREKNERK